VDGKMIASVLKYRSIPEAITGSVISINTVLNLDPSRTTTLRKAFVQDSDRRFRWLMRLITAAIVDLDVFGLKKESVIGLAEIPRGVESLRTWQIAEMKKQQLLAFEEALKTIQAKQFAFRTSAGKVDGFMDWLNEMEERSILQMVRRPGLARGTGAWSDIYIQSAYQKGILRGRHELRNAGVDIPAYSSQEAMSAMFNKPFHAERVGLLFTRTFNELKGIDREMDQAISRVLAQGLAEGRNPRELARILNQQISLPSIKVKLPGDTVRRMTSIQRARTMARTEVIRAHHSATVQEYRDAQVEGVKVKAEWSTAGVGVCPICASLEGEIFTVDKIENMIPAHPNCLIDGQVKIYTSKGWKKIKDVEVGDLVLTHKGRFKKVIQLHKTPKQRPEAVRFRFGRTGQMGLSVTADHPILVDGNWVSARDIVVGNEIHYLAGKCKQCDCLIPYYKKFCSRSCEHRWGANRQWANPEHRKNISNKASVQGKRDRYRITKKANEACRQLVKKGRWVLQQEEIREKGRHLTNTPEMRLASSVRMRKNNPMHDPNNVERMKKSLNELYELYPEKRLNARMAKHRKSGKMTWIEERMSFLLDKLGIKYVFQYPILRYNVDFAIPALRIVIECDGEYWHRDKRQDIIRQKRIEKEGWFVLRYTGTKINQCLEEIEEELLRVFSNHIGDYEFLKLKIVSLEKWVVRKALTLYNLSVEDDESYIANGFVIHNCRCVALPLVKLPGEKEFPLKAPPKAKGIPAEGKPGKVVTVPKKPSVDKAGAKKKWETAKNKYKAETDFSKRSALHLEERKAYYEYVMTMSKDEYRLERQSILRKLFEIEGKTKVPTSTMKKIEKGTDWVPFDILDTLKERNLRVTIKKQRIRASYKTDPYSPTIVLDGRDTFDIIGHEMSHAIDDLVFNRTLEGGWYKAGTGFQWEDNLFVTKEEGKRFRSLFTKKHSGVKGKYTNGDGYYWKDNWIDDYEGRIYTGKSGVGSEWWAMNCQRYTKYRQSLIKYDEQLEQFLGEASRVEKRRGITDPYAKSMRAKADKLAEEGRDVWAARVSGWAKAKERYPELTDFIDDMFGNKFARRSK